MSIHDNDRKPGEPVAWHNPGGMITNDKHTADTWSQHFGCVVEPLVPLSDYTAEVARRKAAERERDEAREGWRNASELLDAAVGDYNTEHDRLTDAERERGTLLHAHYMAIHLIDELEAAAPDDDNPALANAWEAYRQANAAARIPMPEGFGTSITRAISRAEAAEARVRALEAALLPFAAEKLPSTARTEIDFNEHGLRCLMSPMEIARISARAALASNKAGE